MRALVAPDSFKGTLGAVDAAGAIARGLARGGFETEICPLSDGGEGLVECVLLSKGGEALTSRATGPLGEQVDARWALLEGGKTAVIEMAAAAGLPLVPDGKKDPLLTTTRGVGDLLSEAVEHGAEEIIVGVGGSATVDAGCGMARGLGARLLDSGGRELPPGGGALVNLHSMDLSGLDERVRRVRVLVACDVRNPLTGPEGAARVYAPQKGADPRRVKLLERALENFRDVVARELEVDIDAPGCGAAGGLAAGLRAFLGAELRRGAALVMELVGFEERLAGADILVVGEGKLDSQTAFGKAPAEAARVARKLGVPAVAFCGVLGRGARDLLGELLLAAHPLVREGVGPERATAETADALEELAIELAPALRLLAREKP